jgi:uncharacterized phage-associated protein
MDNLSPVDRDELRQKVVDRLLTLYLYNKVSERGRMWGDVKLQKLIFLSEKEMINQQKAGYNYKFFRWEHGPMSKGVYEDHEFLQTHGLVSEESMGITEDGESLLDSASDLLSQNIDFLHTIDEVVDKYGTLSGAKLKQVVYDIEVSPLTRSESFRVEDIPEGVDIFFPLPDDFVEEQFTIDEGWVETLDIMFTKESREGLIRDIQRARETDSIPIELENGE